jgi:hypothetical protein
MITKCRDRGEWGLRWKPIVFDGQIRCATTSEAR